MAWYAIAEEGAAMAASPDGGRRVRAAVRSGHVTRENRGDRRKLATGATVRYPSRRSAKTTRIDEKSS
jgi:hypothetical protein